jgi:hypothetical protein
MSVIQAKTIERNRNKSGKSDRRTLACAAPANHTRDSEEVRCFGTGGGT